MNIDEQYSFCEFESMVQALGKPCLEIEDDWKFNFLEVFERARCLFWINQLRYLGLMYLLVSFGFLSYVNLSIVLSCVSIMCFVLHHLVLEQGLNSFLRFWFWVVTTKKYLIF